MTEIKSSIRKCVSLYVFYSKRIHSKKPFLNKIVTIKVYCYKIEMRWRELWKLSIPIKLENPVSVCSGSAVQINIVFQSTVAVRMYVGFNSTSIANKKGKCFLLVFFTYECTEEERTLYRTLFSNTVVAAYYDHVCASSKW